MKKCITYAKYSIITIAAFSWHLGINPKVACSLSGRISALSHVDQVETIESSQLSDTASAAFYTAGRIIGEPRHALASIQSLQFYFQSRNVPPNDLLKAAILLSKAIELQPRSAHYHIARAEVLGMKRLHELAEQDCHLALKYGVSNVVDGCKIAAWFYNSGDINMSEQVLLTISKIFPNEAKSHHMHGYILSRCGRHKIAIRKYDRAIQLGGNIDGYLIDRAFALAKLHRYHEAKQDLDTVLSKNSENVVALVDRGKILIALGQNHQGDNDISEAHQLNSELAAAAYSSN